jgi:hypothetical protein
LSAPATRTSTPVPVVHHAMFNKNEKFGGKMITTIQIIVQ